MRYFCQFEGGNENSEVFEFIELGFNEVGVFLELESSLFKERFNFGVSFVFILLLVLGED